MHNGFRRALKPNADHKRVMHVKDRTLATIARRAAGGRVAIKAGSYRHRIAVAAPAFPVGAS